MMEEIGDDPEVSESWMHDSFILDAYIYSNYPDVVLERCLWLDEAVFNFEKGREDWQSGQSRL